MKTVRAHYDGNRVLLDEPLPMQKDDKLLVTLVEESDNGEKTLPHFTKEEIERTIGKFPFGGGNALEDTERLYE